MTTKINEKNISNLANLGIDWQSVITADGSTNTNATAGKGYLIDTTSAAHTINLPASPNLGDTIIIRDYAGTFASNNVTIGRNGSNVAGTAIDGTLFTNNIMTTLVYVDTTQGWVTLENEAKSSAILPGYVAATGGTVATSGDYKIHTFTGDGCFVVSDAGNVAGSSSVSYLVVAGGGGGGFGNPGNGGGSGGGAGGYREGKASTDCYSASPLVAPDGLPVSATTYPITVGGGGSGGSPGSPGTSGSNSIFSTITSAGGGGAGGDLSSGAPALAGGSGAGSSAAGNTPPVSPPQGNPGGGSAGGKRGGGGGAIAAGQSISCTNVEPAPSSTPPTGNIGPGNYGWGGNGGIGANTSITASPVTYAGGGGGGGYESGSLPAGRFGAGGRGGSGGGGNARYAPPGFPSNGTAGDTNSGGGGGGGMTDPPSGYGGGSGIVIIRYKFQ